jgi:rod shape-determining protein MreD
MSASSRRGPRLALALFLAAMAQGVYADALQIRGARPDFLTLIAILGALFCDANGGAAVGFFAGLLLASLAAPPHGGFGSLIVSRTLVGFGVGWLEERIFRDNPLTALLLVALGTALADALFFVTAPQPDIPHWARMLGLTTLYNTVLALPLYFLMRRLLRARTEETSP